MKPYGKRTISYHDLEEIDAWKVKIYTIAKKAPFQANEVLENALKKLPVWLAQKNSFDASHEHVAFLIIHAGTEGVFSILNWWVGKNMLNTHVYLTDYKQPGQFQKISGDGLAPCVWELEVIDHERRAWIKHFLKKANQPDLEAYFLEQYNGSI